MLDWSEKRTVFARFQPLMSTDFFNGRVVLSGFLPGGIA